MEDPHDRWPGRAACRWRLEDIRREAGKGTRPVFNQPVKSAARALAVFEYFAGVQRELTVTELATGMKLPLSSASAIAKSLVTMGYLDYNPKRRTYYPTLRIALLGTWLGRRHSEVGLIPDLLSKLVETTRESALISTRNGIFAQTVLVQLSPDPLRLDVSSGMLRPLACSAAGWSLLLNESDVEIGKIVRRTQVEALDPHWREVAREAPGQIALARRRGYAQSLGHITEGVSAISVPIPATDGNPRFAISVGGAIDRVERKKSVILDAIKALLAEINPEIVTHLHDETTMTLGS
jgi:DNA-binding IclR family transcriptional regulator